MIELTGQLICATDEDCDIVRKHLPTHIEKSRAEPGCLRFDVTQDSTDPLVWHVSEAFTSQEAFDAHQARTRSSDWWTATQSIPRKFRIHGSGKTG